MNIELKNKKEREARWFFDALEDMELEASVHNAIFALGEDFQRGEAQFDCGHLHGALEDGLAELVESGMTAKQAFLKIWNSWEG